MGVLRLVSLAACVLVGCGDCTTDEPPTSPPKERAEVARPADPPGSTERPNVLLVVVDTLRADDLGVYGLEQPTSPEIDALAARGTRFARHNATASSTLASVTSILTGRYTRDHGVYCNGVAWPDRLDGVVPAIRDAGWDTAAFVASFALDRRFGLSIGFRHYDDRPGTEHGGGDRWGRYFRRADVMTDATLEWLDGRKRPDDPFFAVVHYYDPHFPYAPPAEHFRPFDVGYEGELTGSLGDLDELRRRLDEQHGELREAGRHARGLHWGEVRFVDAEVGRLLRGLSERGLSDRTMVIFTADHGETFAEHDVTRRAYFSHGWTVHGTEIHVPLIVAGPGVASGRVVPRATTHLDLAPTLLERLGVAERPVGEGRSLVSLLAVGAEPEPVSPDRPPRILIAEATKPRTGAEVVPGALREADWPNQPNARCAIAGRYKLVVTPWLDRRQLFDVIADPLEQRNLWDEPEIATEQRRLEQTLASWAAREAGEGAGERRMDAETRAGLEALGYVQ